MVARTGRIGVVLVCATLLLAHACALDHDRLVAERRHGATVDAGVIGPAAACTPERFDCDGLAANGCEVDLRNSRRHCGVCDSACGLTELCEDRRCRREAIVHFQMSRGGFHACAILESGRAVCWGNNSHGQLGDGTTVDRLLPVEVLGLTRAVEIGAGEHASCARRSDGSVWCWGSDEHGALGDGGGEADRTWPAPVVGLTDIEQLNAGEDSYCARSTTGRVSCWGGNTFARLGDGTRVDRLAPVDIGLEGVTRLEGTLGPRCARASQVWHCWGSNRDSTFPFLLHGSLPDPVPVHDMDAYPQIVVGGRSTLGLTAGGTPHCFGANVGKCARGNVAEMIFQPGAIPGSPRAAQLAINGSSYVLGTRGSVFYFGWDVLRTHNTNQRLTTATEISSMRGAERLGAGIGALCARFGTNALRCVGTGLHGQLGDGTLGEVRVTAAAVIGFE